MARRPAEPDDFGSKLFVVKVPKKVSADGEVVVYADYFQIDSGVLIFCYLDDEENEIFTTAFAPGQWETVHMGHKKYEYPLCAKRWTGLANVRVIQKIVDPPERHITVEKIKEEEVEKKTPATKNEDDE